MPIDKHQESDSPLSVLVTYSNGTSKSFKINFHYKPVQKVEADGKVHLNSCEDLYHPDNINQPGNYVLDNDVSNAQNNGGVCINIDQTSDINFDCQNHTIQTGGVAIGLIVRKVKNFNIKNCKIISDFSTQSAISFENRITPRVKTRGFLTLVPSHNVYPDS